VTSGVTGASAGGVTSGVTGVSAGGVTSGVTGVSAGGVTSGVTGLAVFSPRRKISLPTGAAGVLDSLDF
jgi:hypothetical protein